MLRSDFNSIFTGVATPVAVPLTPSRVRRAQRRAHKAPCLVIRAEGRQKSSLRAAVIDQAPSRSSRSHDEHSETEKKTFNWHKAWYPLQSLKDMDPSKPQAAKLLGKELVLWRDGHGTWRALEDVCPHRRVPLSEGRIEPSNGTLMCSFHGWCFDGEGKCTNIPQCAHLDPASERAACNSSRSRVASYPTQERQGLLWVWGSSGPAAFIEAFATPTVANDLIDTWPQDKIKYIFDNYVRDVPGSIDLWIDNMTDQSHAAFAHNGAVFPAKTELLKLGNMEGDHATIGEAPEDGIVFPYKTIGAPQKRAFVYRPPAFNGLPAAPPDSTSRSLWIYTTPTGTDSTRLIINSLSRTDRPGFALKGWPAVKQFIQQKLLAFIYRSRWHGHLNLHQVDDGDQVLLHKQTANYARMQGSWTKSCFSPATTDRGSLAFRRWWGGPGGNGPDCADKDTTFPDPRAATDVNRRRELLDRFAQHTHMCSACSGALKNVRLLQQAGRIAAIAAGAALVVALGRGLHFVSPISFALVAAGAAALWVRAKLQKLESQFIFTDWRHCEIA